MNTPTPTTCYYEIATYTVTDPESADQARIQAKAYIDTLPGLIEWTHFTDLEDPCQRADLLTWRNLEEARAASRIAEQAPECAAFLACVTHISRMGYYQTAPHPATPTLDAPAMPVPLAGYGVELGTFRLKPGIPEQQLQAAHHTMIQSHLAHQPGWHSQHLVKLENQHYLDLAIAHTEAHARSICASWAGQPDCKAFLDLIEPDTIQFGTLV